jgi:hypothetical protein
LKTSVLTSLFSLLPFTWPKTSPILSRTSDWGFVSHLISQIEYPGGGTITQHDQSILDLHAQSACDTLQLVGESIAFPSPSAPGEKYEAAGEDCVLRPYGESEVAERLVSIATNAGNGVSLQRRTTAATALMNAFNLCITKKSAEQLSPSVTAEERAQKNAMDDVVSSLLEAGTTHKMYECLGKVIPSIIKGILLSFPYDPTTIDFKGEMTGDENENGETTEVPHPGGSVKRPFTTRRLLLVKLMGDVLTYECGQGADDDTPVMDVLSLLSTSGQNIKDNTNNADDKGDKSEAQLMIWQGLCQMFFCYPENNLYQAQFYRLLLGVLKANHEATLKVVIQKSKLVSLMIKAYTKGPKSHHGFILRLLNAIRLRSHSLSPKSFLRHFLDSHDGWKDFLPQIMK